MCVQQSTQKSLLNSLRQTPLFIRCKKVLLLFFNKCSFYREIWNSSLSLATSCDLLFPRNSPRNIIEIGCNFPLPKNCPFPLHELLKWKGLSVNDVGIVVGSYFATSKTVVVWRETMSPRKAIFLPLLWLLGSWETVSADATFDLYMPSWSAPPLQWHGEGTVFI